MLATGMTRTPSFSIGAPKTRFTEELSSGRQPALAAPRSSPPCVDRVRRSRGRFGFDHGRMNGSPKGRISMADLDQLVDEFLRQEFEESPVSASGWA